LVQSNVLAFGKEVAGTLSKLTIRRTLRLGNVPVVAVILVELVRYQVDLHIEV